MRNKKSPSGQDGASSQSKHKDTYSRTQLHKVFMAFHSEPKTMLMVAIETGIERAGVCRYVATLRKWDRITLAGRKLCPITKHRACYYTTDPNFKRPLFGAFSIIEGRNRA